VMRTAQGPFPMETTYTWETTLEGDTRMTLQNRGAPSGFSVLVAPFVARAVRNAAAQHANGADAPTVCDHVTAARGSFATLPAHNQARE
jgi:hypothetical protein